MTKPMSFKQYGEWLFEDDRSSIIYEKKAPLKEGVGSTLLDLGQFVASIIGSIPPLEATGVAEAVDFANGVIYAVRGQYVFAILSFIGAFAPIIGDLFKEGGMITTWLMRLIELEREETKLKQIAEWSLQNAPQLKTGIEKAIPWLRENKQEIKDVIDRASQRIRQTPASELEELNEEVESMFSGPFEALYQAFITNDRVRELFANSSVVNSLKAAVDDLISLLERALETIERLEQEANSEPMNEYTLTEARFKKLAGLLRD